MPQPSPSALAFGEKWGDGILMSKKEYLIWKELDKALGMRELKAMVQTLDTPFDRVLDEMDCYTLNAEFAYGFCPVEAARNYLDTGVLGEYVEKEFGEDHGSWSAEEAYRFTTLSACAMRLGCTMPSKMKKTLEEMEMPKDLPSLATTQLKQAVASYVDGTPYRFGNRHFLEYFVERTYGGTATLTDDDHRVYRTVNADPPDQPAFTILVGASADKESGLPPSFPYDFCGACGGRAQLRRCSRCQQRQYCGPGCQKKHWKTHKAFCRDNKMAMEMVMERARRSYKSTIGKTDAGLAESFPGVFSSLSNGL